MKLPQSFKQGLNLKESQDKKEKLSEEREQNKYQSQLKKHITNKKSLEQVKIASCKKIFRWKEEFLKTSEGANLFKRTDEPLHIFDGGWAHKLPRYGNGCWSRIYFGEDGKIEYSAGYKWMGVETALVFNNPKEMANKLDYIYLKKFLEEIESGQIFKNILEMNLD